MSQAEMKTLNAQMKNGLVARFTRAWFSGALPATHLYALAGIVGAVLTFYTIG